MRPCLPSHVPRTTAADGRGTPEVPALPRTPRALRRRRRCRGGGRGARGARRSGRCLASVQRGPVFGAEALGPGKAATRYFTVYFRSLLWPLLYSTRHGVGRRLRVCTLHSFATNVNTLITVHAVGLGQGCRRYGYKKKKAVDVKRVSCVLTSAPDRERATHSAPASPSPSAAIGIATTPSQAKLIEKPSRQGGNFELEGTVNPRTKER